jgi:hypothetical protein
LFVELAQENRAERSEARTGRHTQAIPTAADQARRPPPGDPPSTILIGGGTRASPTAYNFVDTNRRAPSRRFKKPRRAARAVLTCDSPVRSWMRRRNRSAVASSTVVRARRGNHPTRSTTAPAPQRHRRSAAEQSPPERYLTGDAEHPDADPATLVPAWTRPGPCRRPQAWARQPGRQAYFVTSQTPSRSQCSTQRRQPRDPAQPALHLRQVGIASLPGSLAHQDVVHRDQPTNIVAPTLVQQTQHLQLVTPEPCLVEDEPRANLARDDAARSPS